jgi:hypothetical protein
VKVRPLEMTSKHIVTNVTIARQRLAKRVPERYAVNDRGASVVGYQVAKQRQIIAR